MNVFQSRSHFHRIRTFFLPTSRVPFYSFTWLLLGAGCFGILGCPQDNQNYQSENLRLKKQTAKQESVIASLQEANKVMQQQINLLNQEARAVKKELDQELKSAEEKLQQLSQGHQAEGSRLQELETENRKLSSDARWLRAQRERMRKGLKIQQVGGKTQELSFEFPAVLQVAEKALTRYGYRVMASMQTDQKAVYVTERKTSPPTSLEVAGFRNQYLLAVSKGQKSNAKKTTIWVKAEFEKISQNGNVFGVSAKELSDIELRLIQEIQRTLQNGQSAKKSPAKN